MRYLRTFSSFGLAGFILICAAASAFAGSRGATILEPAARAVIITAPVKAARVEGTISFAAIIGTSVQWMDFYVDGKYLASSPPAAILWDSTSVPDGAHTLSVKGFDASNKMVAHPSVKVTIDNVAATPSRRLPHRLRRQPQSRRRPRELRLRVRARPQSAIRVRPSNDIPNNRVPTRCRTRRVSRRRRRLRRPRRL